MTKLHECLYQYIAEERFSILKEDKEFAAVEKRRDEVEERLSSGLTEEQRRLFSRYMDEENYLTSLHLRHIFQETLQIAHELLISHYSGSLSE